MQIGITGCTGRVGQLLVKELRSGEWTGLELCGGSCAQADIEKQDFFATDDPDELFAKADIVIDFTAPAGTRKHLWQAVKHKTPLVIGTTGLSASDEAEIKEAALEVPILYAPNMSVGVNVLLAAIENLASKLPAERWDIEIFEAHHKHKVDAPSGTALALGEAAAKGRSVALDEVAKYARHEDNTPRKEGDIGFSVARGGDVVGEHRVFFYAEGERIELSHMATNRTLFAKGALRAAQWLDGKAPGLYSMRDVLEI